MLIRSRLRSPKRQLFTLMLHIRDYFSESTSVRFEMGAKCERIEITLILPPFSRKFRFVKNTPDLLPLFPKKTNPQNLTQEPPASSLAALAFHKGVRASRRLESDGFARFCGASRYPPGTFVFLAQRGFKPGVFRFILLYCSERFVERGDQVLYVFGAYRKANRIRLDALIQQLLFG